MQPLQCDFCGVFLGVVDVLAVVPVPSSHMLQLALDTHGAGPSSSSAWELGVSLRVFFLCFIHSFLPASLPSFTPFPGAGDGDGGGN